MDRLQKLLVGGTMSLLAIVIAVLAYGCTASQRGVMNTPQRSLVLSKCGACHLLPDANSVGAEMARKILRDHENRVRLNAEETQNVVDYLASSGESDR